MLVTLIRSLIIFLTLMVVMRLMGKRQIGEMQPYEFIVTLIIADLACIPMADVSIPIIYGIVAILGLFLFHQLLSLIEQGGNFFKRVISGKPSIVINKLGVDIKELKRNNMGVSDLIDSMRSQGYFSLDDLDYAIFESNGKLSTLENPEYKNNTKTSIPLLVIDDGKIDTKNASRFYLDKQKILQFFNLTPQKLQRIEVLTIDGNGKVYYKEKNKKFSTFFFPMPKGVKW